MRLGSLIAREPRQPSLPLTHAPTSSPPNGQVSAAHQPSAAHEYCLAFALQPRRLTIAWSVGCQVVLDHVLCRYGRTILSSFSRMSARGEQDEQNDTANQ